MKQAYTSHPFLLLFLLFLIVLQLKALSAKDLSNWKKNMIDEMFTRNLQN